MKKLNRKIILEFLEDESFEKSVEKEPVEEIKEVQVEAQPEHLSEEEKKNFIISTLTDLSAKVIDLFNYLTPLMTLEVDNENSSINNLSQENKDLLRSIYEDVSLMMGKVTQGLKDNTEENIQGAIDDGQTQAQELTTPSTTDMKEE